MSIDADDVEAQLPIVDTEEIVVPTSGGCAYAEGLIDTTLADGDTTLVVNCWGDDVAVTVKHEEAGLALSGSATLSTEDLRSLRDAVDDVLGELEGEHE